MKGLEELRKTKRMKICKILTKKMVDVGVVGKQEVEIYNFGLECLVLKVITFFTYIGIAVIMKKIMELFIIMLVFIPLRRNAGGYHAETRRGCYLISCGALFLTLVACDFNFNVWVVVVFLIIADIFLVFVSPIDNENKKMDIEERKIFRLKTRKIVLRINIVFGVLMLLQFFEICKMISLGMLMALFFLLAGRCKD